jgi:hypothetical protein
VSHLVTSDEGTLHPGAPLSPGASASALPTAPEGRGEPNTPSPCSSGPAPASTLSPAAAPFYPEVASADRVMANRWMDFSDADDEDEVIDAREVAAPSQTPYLDVVRRGPAPASKLALRSIVVQPPRGEGGHRKRPRWRGRRPPSPPPWCRSRRGTRWHGTTETVIGLRRYDHPH